MSQRPPSDTDPSSALLQENLLRRLTAGEKLYQMCRLCAVGRSLVLGQIKREHPDCSEAEMMYWFAERTLGRELAQRYFLPEP